MRKTRIIMSLMMLLALWRPGAAEEMRSDTEENKWYVPVAVGAHIDSDNVKEERLSSAQAKGIFQKEAMFTRKDQARFEALRGAWLKKNTEDHRKKIAADSTFDTVVKTQDLPQNAQKAQK